MTASGDVIEKDENRKYKIELPSRRLLERNRMFLRKVKSGKLSRRGRVKEVGTYPAGKQVTADILSYISFDIFSSKYSIV